MGRTGKEGNIRRGRMIGGGGRDGKGGGGGCVNGRRGCRGAGERKGEGGNKSIRTSETKHNEDAVIMTEMGSCAFTFVPERRGKTW